NGNVRGKVSNRQSVFVPPGGLNGLMPLTTSTCASVVTSGQWPSAAVALICNNNNHICQQCTQARTVSGNYFYSSSSSGLCCPLVRLLTSNLACCHMFRSLCRPDIEAL